MKLLKLTFTALASMILLATTFQSYYGYDSGNKRQRFLVAEQNSEAEHEMFVTVLLKAEDFRLISNSFFFKAALEQSLKDFINGNPLCDDGHKDDEQFPSYSSFDLLNSTSQDAALATMELNNTFCESNLLDVNDLRCYVVVKVKCRGQRQKCTKRVNEKFHDSGKTKQTNKTESQKSACEFDINDLLKEKYSSSSIFLYNVIESAQIFAFDFQQLPNTSLSDVDDVKARDNIAEVDEPCFSECVSCSEYCKDQPNILRDFYDTLGLDLHYAEHECEFQGINCDNEKKATQIWLSKFLYLFELFVNLS